MAALTELLDVSADQSKVFCKDFFLKLDKREAIPALLPTTTVLWNGTALVGGDAFAEMFSRMPQTEHEVSGYNVHPLPYGNKDALNMMIDVTGRCQLGCEKGRNIFAFAAMFVVRRQAAGAPLIAHTMSYRLVHKPTDATIQT